MQRVRARIETRREKSALSVYMYDHLPTPETTTWDGHDRLAREVPAISPCWVAEKDLNAICGSVVGAMPMATTEGGDGTGHEWRKKPLLIVSMPLKLKGSLQEKKGNIIISIYAHMQYDEKYFELENKRLNCCRRRTYDSKKVSHC